MPDRLNREMSEGERRDLVRDIASRRERGYEIRDTVVQPQVDYAAAAAAAVAADPVELAPASEEELNETAGAAAEAGSAYAEAQRAIFDRGVGRELDYGNVWYDDQQGMIDATNVALDEYQAAVDRARSAAGSGDALGDDEWWLEEEEQAPSLGEARMLLSGGMQSPVEPYGSTEDFLNMRDTAQTLFSNNAPILQLFTPDPATGVAAIDQILEQVAASGMTWDMAVDHIANVLSRDPALGATREQIRRIMLSAAPQWMERLNAGARGSRRPGGSSYQPMPYAHRGPLDRIAGMTGAVDQVSSKLESKLSQNLPQRNTVLSDAWVPETGESFRGVNVPTPDRPS